QQPHGVHAHRQLAGPGAEQRAARAHQVADVPALEGLVGGAERLLLQVQLNLPRAVGDFSEARLAHDALEHQPSADRHVRRIGIQPLAAALAEGGVQLPGERVAANGWMPIDRKSTRLNSSHVKISYAVFCLKKKKKK